jgi:hypothetical protein
LPGKNELPRKNKKQKEKEMEKLFEVAPDLLIQKRLWV